MLLFILTAKKQLIQLDANAAQAQAAGLALNAAVSAAQSELNSLEPVAAQSSANQSISLAELQAEQAHLDQQIASRRSSLDGLANTVPQPASQRPLRRPKLPVWLTLTRATRSHFTRKLWQYARRECQYCAKNDPRQSPSQLG